MSSISWCADRRHRSVWRTRRIFFKTYLFLSTLCLTRSAEPNEPFPICSNTSYCSIF
uniref:NEK3 n=1 Tax=Arundo donax TaxID=35708 RepID=A0A0A9BIX7_ARUDO